MSSILFATSPLQVKIAQRVLKEYPNHDFKTIFFTPNLNPKHKRYAAECDLVFELQTVQQTTDFIEQFSGDYQTILFASFDNPVIAKIVKQSTYQELASYDDGYASIFPHGMYAVKAGDDIYNEAKLFLKEHTQKHYTIYKSDFHVIPAAKRVFLDGVFDLDYPKVTNGKVVKLLLGQNLLLHTHSHNAATIVRYYNGLNIDYYLPHPKEVGFIPGLNVLETDLTLEDLLLELWKDYENIIVYHFYSSTALHLIDRENVKAIGIRLPHLKLHQERLEELGCTYEDIDLGW